jgi:type II secretory pathway component PulM
MIKQRWEQLSSRDQRTLKIGGIVLGVLIALRFIWWPIFDRVTILKNEIDNEQSLINWMTPRVAQLQESKKSAKAIKKDKSLAAFEKSLQQAGLKPYVKDLSQNPQKQISVTFSEVPFESTMHWLEKAQQSGWVVQQMSAQKGEKSGIVNLTMVLG